MQEEVWEPVLARAGADCDHTEDRSGPALQPHFLPKAWPHMALMWSGQGRAWLNQQWDQPGQGHTSSWGQLGTRGARPKCCTQGHLPSMVYSAVSAAACTLPALTDAFGAWLQADVTLCCWGHVPGLGHVPSIRSLDDSFQSWAVTCTSKTSSHIRLQSCIKTLRD